jgi:hypothetical protein
MQSTVANAIPNNRAGIDPSGAVLFLTDGCTICELWHLRSPKMPDGQKAKARPALIAL